MNLTESITVIEQIVDEVKREKISQMQGAKEIRVELDIKTHKTVDLDTALGNIEDIVSEHHRGKLSVEDAINDIKNELQ